MHWRQLQGDGDGEDLVYDAYMITSQSVAYDTRSRLEAIVISVHSLLGE